MSEYKITLSVDEEKALLADMISIQDWLPNAIKNIIRQCVDAIVEQVSDKQPEKLSLTEKHAIVRFAKIETALDRDKRKKQSV